MRYVLFAMVLVFSIIVQAGCNSNSCTGKGPDLMKLLFPNHSGKGYIWGPADRGNLNCNLVEGKYMVLKGGVDGHPLFKEMYSTMLTGLASGKQMKIRVTEGSPDCEVMYVWIWS